MIKTVFIFFLFLLLISCSEEIHRTPKPDNLIPVDTMVMVLRDLSVLESHIKNKYPQISQNYITMRKSGNILLKKYGLDTNRLDASMDYYGARQKEMQEIYSQVLDSVNRELTELTAK